MCVSFQYIVSDFLYFSKSFWNYVFKYLSSIMVFVVSRYSYVEYPFFYIYYFFSNCLFLYFYFTCFVFNILCYFSEMPFLSRISSIFNCTSMIFLFFPDLSSVVQVYITSFVSSNHLLPEPYIPVLYLFSLFNFFFLFKIYSKRFNYSFHSLCGNIFVRVFFFFWSNSFSCNFLPLFCPLYRFVLVSFVVTLQKTWVFPVSAIFKRF